MKSVENRKEKRPRPSVCGRAAEKQTFLLLPAPEKDIKHQPWQGQHSRHLLVLRSPGSTLSLRGLNGKMFRAGFCSQLSQLGRSGTSPDCSAPRASKTCPICAVVGADVHKPLGYFWWLSGFPAQSLQRAPTSAPAGTAIVSEKTKGKAPALVLTQPARSRGSPTCRWLRARPGHGN